MQEAGDARVDGEWILDLHLPDHELPSEVGLDLGEGLLVVSVHDFVGVVLQIVELSLTVLVEAELPGTDRQLTATEYDF